MPFGVYYKWTRGPLSGRGAVGADPGRMEARFVDNVRGVAHGPLYFGFLTWKGHKT